MQRKTIQMAKNTLVVSLPAKWVKQFNISKGDPLELIEQGSILKILPVESHRKEEISINISKLSERTFRWLVSATHKSGFNEFKFTSIKEVDFSFNKVMHDLLSNLLLGYAIIEQHSNSVIVKNLQKPSEDFFEKTFRRAFRVTVSLSNTVLEAFQDQKYEELKDAYSLEATNNMLTNFCEKILNTIGKGEKTCFYYAIARNLEKIADNYKYICNEYKKSNNKISKNTLRLFSGVNKNLEEYQNLFYSFDLKKLTNMDSSLNRLLSDLKQELKKSNPNERILLSYLIFISQQCKSFSTSMIAIHHPSLNNQS